MPPRSATRQRAATPARATRTNSIAAQDTPAGRRSTRATSRQTAETKDVVSNPALPEIRTHQSYAYGASKAPALPEQLQAKNLNMNAVADRMKSAIESAEKNFEAHAADTRGFTPESQVTEKNLRTRGRASKEPPLPSNSPEQVRKTRRTAEWIESSQLDDITEESNRSESSERIRDQDTDPSSFPSGIFDHSYNYERGLRGPRLKHQVSWREKLQQFRSETASSLKALATQCLNWLSRLLLAVQRGLEELPESDIFVASVKGVGFVVVLAFCGAMFCGIWSRMCAPDSPSIISQSLTKLCGRCTNEAVGLPYMSFNASAGDLESFNRALNARYAQLQQQIERIETRIGSKLENKESTLTDDISMLRQQQEAIELQIRRVGTGSSQSLSSSYDAVPSPLIPKINFFSLPNGAIVDPHLSSPTRQKLFSLPTRFALSVVGLSKYYKALPPATALASWQDEGDCWCAAQPGKKSKQEQIRLVVSVRELIYPTELIVEHFPAEGSLVPETAPRDIELWADFSHLSPTDFHQRLRIPDLQLQAARDAAEAGVEHDPLFGVGGNKAKHPAIDSWARVGKATYVAGKTSSGARHVQTFRLDINQNGNLHYTDKFVVRVLTNHGADYTCLYRVRLHGVPMEKRKGLLTDEEDGEQ